MQAGHFFLNTTFFVVEIFAGRFAAISNILLSGRNPVLWTSMPPGMNYWKTVRLSSPPNRGGGLIAPRFDWVNLFCLLLALWVTDPPICSFLTAFRRKHFILRGYAPQAARGVVCANAPFFPQFAISNPLRLSRMALRLAHLICSLGSTFAPFTGWRSFRPLWNPQYFLHAAISCQIS